MHAADLADAQGSSGHARSRRAKARRDPITLASLFFGILAALTLPVLYPLPSTLFAILGTASAIIGLIRSRTSGSRSALPIASLILSLGIADFVALSVVFGQGVSSGPARVPWSSARFF